MTAFSSKDSLEGRVVLFISRASSIEKSPWMLKSQGHLAHLADYPYEIEVADKLPELSAFNNFSTIVISDETYLDNRLLENLTVPVILLKEFLPALNEREAIVKQHNLYRLAEFPIDDAIHDALEDQLRIKRYLEFYVRDDSQLISGLEQPKICRLADIARHAEKIESQARNEDIARSTRTSERRKRRRARFQARIRRRFRGRFPRAHGFR